MLKMRNEFVGSGWAFPVGVTPEGRIRVSRDEDRIVESIYLILSTARGERAMRPDFGCGIHELLFEPINQATIALMEHYVQEALVRFEPRIEVRKVHVTSHPTHADLVAPPGTKRLPSGEVVPPGGPSLGPADGVLFVHIEYRVWQTDTIFNLVYPFYIERGAQ